MDTTKLRSGKVIFKGKRVRCPICDKRCCQRCLDDVLARYGNCGLNGQFIGSRCLECHQKITALYVKDNYESSDDSDSDSDSDLDSYTEEQWDSAEARVSHLGRILATDVESLVVAESEAQGYTPIQAHEFAMRLTFYTESVVQTVSDTYENYVQQPE
jgi:hypothetical protein